MDCRFNVGDGFTSNPPNLGIITIESINDNGSIILSYIYDGQKRLYNHYTITDANRYFNSGIWIKVIDA